jgi:hypothetical protein
VFGPLSRSEKKIRGGAICADMKAAEKTKERTETIFRNLSIATPTSNLGGKQKRTSAGLFRARE